MSVCIAAVCDWATGIITVHDFMLSLEHTSAEVVFKMRSVHCDWDAMFAGNDVSPVTPILNSVRTRLAGKKKKYRALMLPEVVRAFSEAYQEELKARAEAKILARFGIGMEQFVLKGKKLFSLAEHESIFEQISNFRLDCRFLVSGFDADDVPHIFSIENPGVPVYHDSVGFWVIGSGKMMALATLLGMSYNPMNEWPTAMYDVVAAKISSETATGVGKGYFTSIRRARGITSWGDLSAMTMIRESWEKSRPKPSPEVLEGIRGLMPDADRYSRHSAMPSTSQTSTPER